MRNRYHSLHSHAHIQIFVKLLTVILVWRQGKKVREVFQLEFWEQVYSFVMVCPKSAPSKQRYTCRKQHETTAYYSMKLLPYIFSFRCVSTTVGLSLWELCFKSIISKYNICHVILTMNSALHRISQPCHWDDSTKEKVHVEKVLSTVSFSSPCLASRENILLVWKWCIALSW